MPLDAAGQVRCDFAFEIQPRQIIAPQPARVVIGVVDRRIGRGIDETGGVRAARNEPADIAAIRRDLRDPQR